MTTLDQCNRSNAASRMIFLYSYLIIIVSYRDRGSTMVPYIMAATAEATDDARSMHPLQSDSAMTNDDADNDSRKNEKLYDWLDEDDNYDDDGNDDYDDDDDDDLTPVRVDKDLGERMSGFFDKLNSLRRKYREERRKSKRRPFESGHQSAIKLPIGDGAAVKSVQMTDVDHHVRLLMDPTPTLLIPAPRSAKNDRQTGWDKGT